jgi:hypothetical protein
VGDAWIAVTALALASMSGPFTDYTGKTAR